MNYFKLEFFTPFDKPSFAMMQRVIRFVSQHAVNQTAEEEIQKAIEYAIKERPSHGGFVIVVGDFKQIYGAAILNQSGLDGILPDYILSHFVVDATSTSFFKIKNQMTRKAIELSSGNIATVIPDDVCNLEGIPSLMIYKSSEVNQAANKSIEDENPRIRVAG